MTEGRVLVDITLALGGQLAYGFLNGMSRTRRPLRPSRESARSGCRMEGVAR